MKKEIFVSCTKIKWLNWLLQKFLKLETLHDQEILSSSQLQLLNTYEQPLRHVPLNLVHQNSQLHFPVARNFKKTWLPSRGRMKRKSQLLFKHHFFFFFTFSHFVQILAISFQPSEPVHQGASHFLDFKVSRYIESCSFWGILGP